MRKEGLTDEQLLNMHFADREWVVQQLMALRDQKGSV
jgi:hypothetical protein